MVLCNKINLISFMEKEEISKTTQDHVMNCPVCRGKIKEFTILLGLLTAVEKKSLSDPAALKETPLPAEPLPVNVRQLVAARRKKWQKEQAAGVAEKMGYKNQKQKDNIIELMTDRKDVPFLNAAFPDDLIEGDSKSDKDK